MSAYSLKDFDWLVGGMVDERKQTVAKQLRGDHTPDWLEAFFTSFAGEDPTLNKQTGRRHTVESMVEELKERVRLDAIEKTASVHPPLRMKLAEHVGEQNADALLAEMGDYALRHHIIPHNGQLPTVALYEAIKDQFDIDGIEKAGGKDRIVALLNQLLESHRKPNLVDNLPKYDGTPIQMGRENNDDQGNFLHSDNRKM